MILKQKLIRLNSKPINIIFLFERIVLILLIVVYLIFIHCKIIEAKPLIKLEDKENKILNINKEFNNKLNKNFNNNLTQNLVFKDNIILPSNNIKTYNDSRIINFNTPIKDISAIDALRQYYASPVKDLNTIIKQTGSALSGLPYYSMSKSTPYIQGDFSSSKPKKSDKNKKINIFDWLSEEGKYSKFSNDPEYTSNIDFSIDMKPSETINKFNYDNIETSIINLKVNKRFAYDFEVIIWQDGTISVPILTLADIVNTRAEFNDFNGTISLKHPNTDENILIDYKNNNIKAGHNLINIKNPKLIYIKKGILVENDVFVSQSIARDILDIDTDFINQEYTMDVSSNRPLKATIEITEASKNSTDYVIEDPSSNNNVIEKENKVLKINNISYNLGSSVNQSSNNIYSNAYSNLTGGFNATGNLLGGKFNLGANTYYGKQGLTISGYRASLDYLKPQYELSIGSTNSSLSELTLPNSNIWGFRLGSVGASNSSSYVPRLIEGKAEDNSQVELYINNIYTDKQLVKNGRFEFDSIRYQNGPFVHIKVVQINNNGSKKTIYDRKFSQDRDLLAPGQKEFLVFSGLNTSALSNSLRLFGDSFDNSYIQPVKFISGAKFRTGVSEDLTIGINIAKDFIIRQPSKFNSSLFKNLSTARVTRTGRTSSGTIISLDLDYVPTENLRIASELGFSSSLSKIDPGFDPTGADFGGFISANYQKDNYALRGKLFSYGSNFYTPSSTGLIDKRGIELSGYYKFDKVNLSGNLTKYSSNLDNYFDGGRFEIFNYNLAASGKLDEKSDIRIGLASSSAKNALYNDKNVTYDITINRKLSDKADLTINYAKTMRQNRDSLSDRSNKDNHNRLNVDLSYDADKIGIIRLSHEMMMLNPVERLLMAEIDDAFYYEPVYSKNLRLTLDRSSLPIKGFTMSPNVGYRYGGNNKGLNFGFNLGYMFKTGKQISLNYAYNSSFGRYMAGVLNFGGSKSHSISFNFSDNLNFLSKNRLNGNSINNSPFDLNSAIIKGSVYADLNQNGQKDEGEFGLPGIDILTHNFNTVTTDDKGEFITTTPIGTRVIGVDKDTLPVFYNPNITDAIIKVRPQKVYIANFGVILTPGNISGKVEVAKEGVYNNNVVVSLIDKYGKEIKYTTTDSNGEYYLDSIPPGEYDVVIENNYLKQKGLQYNKSDTHKVIIPMIDNDVVILEDINFQLIPQKGELKQFQ